MLFFDYYRVRMMFFPPFYILGRNLKFDVLVKFWYTFILYTFLKTTGMHTLLISFPNIVQQSIFFRWQNCPG